MNNKEAIKEIQKWMDGCPFEDTKEAFMLAIKALEVRPHGKWKIEGALIACDVCGQILLKASKLYKYCPNCGADMRGDTK